MINSKRALEIIRKVESYDNGIEWDNDNDCWNLEDNTYNMLLELLEYTKTIIK